ncbi:MAG: hypothetical protein OXT70_00980 [Chloroflexota bacterium]|nr:hypothetical protein [Chloroflexota bacterium]
MKFTFVGFQGSSDLTTLPDTWAKFGASALAELPDHSCVYVPDGVGVTHFIGVPSANILAPIPMEDFDSLEVEYEFPTTRILTAETEEELARKIYEFWTRDHYEVEHAIPGGIEIHKVDLQGRSYAELILTLSE